jgi:hypothetical protein
MSTYYETKLNERVFMRGITHEQVNSSEDFNDAAFILRFEANMNARDAAVADKTMKPAFARLAAVA